MPVLIFEIMTTTASSTLCCPYVIESHLFTRQKILDDQFISGGVILKSYLHGIGLYQPLADRLMLVYEVQIFF
jgi:hypothetical protein